MDGLKWKILSNKIYQNIVIWGVPPFWETSIWEYANTFLTNPVNGSFLWPGSGYMTRIWLGNMDKAVTWSLLSLFLPGNFGDPHPNAVSWRKPRGHSPSVLGAHAAGDPTTQSKWLKLWGYDSVHDSCGPQWIWWFLVLAAVYTLNNQGNACSGYRLTFVPF